MANASEDFSPSPSPRVTPALRVEDAFRPGQKVVYRDIRCVVRYVGRCQFAAGPWVGIEILPRTKGGGRVSPSGKTRKFDMSMLSGKNDGWVDGVQYFKCKYSAPEQNMGLFVRPRFLVSLKALKTGFRARRGMGGGNSMTESVSEMSVMDDTSMTEDAMSSGWPLKDGESVGWGSGSGRRESGSGRERVGRSSERANSAERVWESSMSGGGEARGLADSWDSNAEDRVDEGVHSGAGSGNLRSPGGEHYLRRSASVGRSAYRQSSSPPRRRELTPSELEDFPDKDMELNAYIDALRARVKQFEMELEEERAVVMDRDIFIDELRSRLARQPGPPDPSQNEKDAVIDTLQKDLAQLKAELRERQGAAEELKDARAELQALRQQVASSDGDNTVRDVRMQLDGMRHRLEDTERQLRNAQAAHALEVRNLQEDVSAAKLQNCLNCEKLRNQIELLQAAHDSAEASKANLAADLTRLEGRYKTDTVRLEGALSDARRLLKESHGRIADPDLAMQAQLDNERARADAAEKSANEWQRRCRDAGGSDGFATVLQENAELKAKVESDRSIVDALIREVAALSTDLHHQLGVSRRVDAQPSSPQPQLAAA